MEIVVLISAIIIAISVGMIRFVSNRPVNGEVKRINAMEKHIEHTSSLLQVCKKKIYE